MEEIIREATIEELEAEYKALGEKLYKKKHEEEARRQAELAHAQNARKKVIEEKEKELLALIRDYVKDYGTYCSTRYRTNDDTSVWSCLHDLFF